MLVLNEETVKEFIKQELVFVKVYADNCPYCTRLDEQLPKIDLSGYDTGMLKVSHPMDKTPQPSEFKRTWMRQDKSDVIKDSVPALFVFERGELKQRHFGMLYSDSLQHWLATGQVIPSKIQQQEKAAEEKRQKAYQLFAKRGELTYNIELLTAQLQKINSELVEVLK